MTLETVRAAIKAKMESVDGIGTVHGFQRYAKKQEDFRTLYQVGGRVLGWHIRRISTVEREGASTFNTVVHRWRIEGFMSLDDATESEITMDGKIEALRDAFRVDETLGGTVQSTLVDNQAGLQVEDSGPVMFAGVLCHSVRLSLSTECVAEIDEAAIDDFVTAGVTWEKEPFDVVADAEDIIKPEQPL